MTSSAEKIAEALLAVPTKPPGRSFRSPMRTADRLAVGSLPEDPTAIPGTRSVLPIDVWGAAADLIDQPQYRAGHTPGGQTRRPAMPQTAPPRGTNVWGSAPGQLGGVRPRPA